jgi:hypothetical protein
MKQSNSQHPTEYGGPQAVGIGDWPIAKVNRVASTGVGDDGMVGHHSHDHVIVHNAHPHQEHSVGYHDSGTEYINHGFESVHFTHGKRDKGAEHHPPQGLMETGALQSGKQKVFG